MLKQVLPHTATCCARALVMPNTVPPVATADDVKRYRLEITKALPKKSDFAPLMTFKILPGTTPAQIVELKKAGVVAGKLYPEGVTTNSEDGVKDIQALYPVFSAMQNENLVFCLHGEVPNCFCLDREEAFLVTLEKLAADFPKLKIVLEHATTAAAVKMVKRLPDHVAATLTVHHLMITLDDVVGDKINPHHFCKPIAKKPTDRSALVQAATSGNPKFFLGTDSAPHTVESKECCCGAAGVYTAPVMLPVLAELFEKENALDKLEAFCSRFGANFYGLPLNQTSLKLKKEAWKVPDQFGDVVPFMAGQTLLWQLESHA